MKFTYRFSSLITGINTNMLLIFLFGLIAILASVSDGCDVGTTEVENFNWKLVGVSVITQILTHHPLKLVLAFIYHLWFY
jgi:TctA family transporter